MRLRTQREVLRRSPGPKNPTVFSSKWTHAAPNLRDVVAEPCGQSLSNSKCNPSRTALTAGPLNLPVHSTSSDLSIVRIWDTFTTLAFERLASPLFRSTLPGAPTLLRFEVIRHTTLVAIALWLKISFCTTTHACRSAGAEPAGRPKSSQYTCPCRISLTNV